MDKNKLPFNGKWSFHAERMKCLMIFALISLFCIQQSFAQRITRQYNNVSFSAALKDLNAHQKAYSINFVYDELEDFKVTKSIRNQSVPDAIMQLIGFYPIKMKVIDHVIIVECTQKSATEMMGRIVDSRHRAVDFANVALLNVNDSSFITGGVTNESGQLQVSDETEKDGGEKRVIQSDYSADSWMYASKLVLSVPLWKGSFKVGNEYTSSCRANLYTIDEQGENLPGKTDDQVKETNLATFFSYALRWNQVDMNLGLRYEHVASNYINLGRDVWDEGYQTSQPDLSRKYDNFFPNVSVSFPIKNVKVSTSYRVVVSRPSYQQLSSNVQYNSRYFYQGGNPLLQPTYEHTVSLNVGYRWFQLFVNWRYVENASYWCIDPYEDSGQIYMYSYRNLKHSQSYSAGLTAAPKIGWWQPQLNLSVRKQMMKIGEISYDHPRFMGSLNNTFEIPGGWVLNLDMDYRARGHYSTIEYMQQGGVDVSLRKGFLHNRLNVTLLGTDIFATRRLSYRFVYGTVDNSVWKYTDTRKLVCSISYQLNASRSKYKGTGAGKAEKSRM